MNEILTSAIVSQQLPDFVRGDYPNFVTFLQKYYEWMELTGNASYEAQQLGVIQDVDLAPDYYIDQIRKEFLPYFPEVSTLDSRKFIKLVNQFYAAKGTPDSVKFLFRAIFNEEIEITFPKDDILKASDGKWVLPLALRIDTNDLNILNISNSLITGQTSKATAIVETVVRSIDRQLGITYIEAYVSNVQRLFQTGETVTATYNNGLIDVTVSGKLIGALSEILIDSNNRGLYYNAYDPSIGYQGDPVSIVGGLNPTSNTPIGAVAYVGSTTKGAITDIAVINGGFGFRDQAVYPGSSLVDFKNGFDNTVFGSEAQAEISLLDFSTTRTINVANTSIETLYSLTLDQASQNSNVQNSSISTLSTYQSLNVYPISFVTITGDGGGYASKPEVEVYSFYNENNDDVLVINSCNIVKNSTIITDNTQDLTVSFEIGDTIRLFISNKLNEIRKVIAVTTNTITLDVVFLNDISGVQVYKVTKNTLSQIGSLGLIQVVNPGINYNVGEYIIFTGGSGYGANASIKEVYANNGIKTVQFNPTSGYVIAGEAYTTATLPSISVNTVSGTGAQLVVNEIAGDGESLGLTTTRIGAISSLRVVSYGYDYVSVPSVSLRNADLYVSNVTSGQIFVSNTAVYQGATNTSSTWTAYVDSFDPDTGRLRVFDYKGTFNDSLIVKSLDNLVSANVSSILYYGDGRAKATANFENGLIRYPGIYLNTDGHLSSDKRLQDGKYYHNFSYVINTNQDYSTFKTPLNNIVHPIGTITFVNRMSDHLVQVSSNLVNQVIKTSTLTNTFNITSGTKNIVSTNVSANLRSTISVGDVITVQNLVKSLSGTGNTTSGSNTIIGISTNFLNQLQDGDIVRLSTGNTETVTVTGNTSLYTQNTIGVTATGVLINLVFNDTKTVTFVNANTILVDTNFSTNASYANVSIQKVS